MGLLWGSSRVLPFVLLLLTLGLGDGKTLNVSGDSIQITANFRSLVTGPVDDTTLLTQGDTVSVYAGELSDDPDVVRKWLLWGHTDDGKYLCYLQQVIEYGESVVFVCPAASAYIAMVKDELPFNTTLSELKPKMQKTELVLELITPFDLSLRYHHADDVVYYEHFKAAAADYLKEAVISDPIEIVPSDYCYYWNFQYRETSRVGFIYGQEEQRQGVITESSYILAEIIIWVEELAVGTEGRFSGSTKPGAEDHTSQRISSYSRLLSRVFNSRGLQPCLRKVHPAIEIVGDAVFSEQLDISTESPHWLVKLKIHMDRIVSTITDMTVTLSSRQHVSLYNCFVGDVRIFIRTRNFEFLPAGRSDLSSLKLEFSTIPPAIVDYMKLKVHHVWGHRVTYVGTAHTRHYEPGYARTDATGIVNPCMVQELVVAAAGNVYVATRFLTKFSTDMTPVVLPGFQRDTFDISNITRQAIAGRHKAYLRVADMALISTHLILLMEDSTIYAHSRSPYQLGLAFLASTVQSRLTSLVKRRWCPRTGTILKDSLIIPAFSSTGNIILIQMYPSAGNLAMELGDLSNSCAVPNPRFFELTEGEVRKSVNESCIHQASELQLNVSDSSGLPSKRDLTRCREPSASRPINISISDKHPWKEKSFIMNQDNLLSNVDPHFPKDLENPALYRTKFDPDAMKLRNKALIFYLDKADDPKREIPNALESGGLEINENIIVHDMAFTANDHVYLVGVEFIAENFVETVKTLPASPPYDFTLMVTTLTTRNMPIKLVPDPASIEERLNVEVAFPGVIIVRHIPYMLKNFTSDNSSAPPVPYVTKIFPLSTAVPTHVIDLGNAYIFTSVDTKYARVLTYIARNKIKEVLHAGKQKLLANDESVNQAVQLEDLESLFTPNYECESRDCVLDPLKPSVLFDIAVSQYGSVSILRRREMNETVPTPQSAYIGHAMLDVALREVRPFAIEDQVFQFAAPDGEIVYGDFSNRSFPQFPNCSEHWIKRVNEGNSSEVTRSCVMPHGDTSKNPFCAVPKRGRDNSSSCLEWKLDPTAAMGNSAPKDKDNILSYCDNNATASIRSGCVVKSTADSGLPPEGAPDHDLEYMEILNTPYFSLLHGNLLLAGINYDYDQQRQGEPDFKYKFRLSDGNILHSDDRLCPFVALAVQHQPIVFVEIGFRVRITVDIAYLGIDIPPEAEAIIEHPRVLGIQVDVSSSMKVERDQTVLTKTIDIAFTLADRDLQTMKQNGSKTWETSRKRNVAAEDIKSFSITIRPAVINMLCKKEDYFVVINYGTGCDPFTEIRLVAEAVPVTRKIVKPIAEVKVNDSESQEWGRDGDFLSVPRDHVWHRQRLRFGCGHPDNKRCKIPYANFYQDNVFDINWRDEFVPQFEQFLRNHSREVTGNVVVYDLFGFNIARNISFLEAGCHHTASLWYDDLLRSTNYTGTDTTVQEDVYQYFVNCFDQTFSRNMPLDLHSTEYSLINRTNFNRIRFDIASNVRRTKNRNQFLLLRAAVINTDFNRFSYCKLLDTFFLIRIVGLPAPKKNLSRFAYLVIPALIALFLLLSYVFFSFWYTWKLDVANLKADPDKGLQQDLESADSPALTPTNAEAAAEELLVQQRAKATEVKLQAMAEFREYKNQQGKGKK